MLHQLIHTLIVVLLSLWAYMSTWFILAVIIKRNDVADIAWGMGFILAIFVGSHLNHGNNFTVNLVSILVIIWGLRLAWHITTRNIKKPEDYRYLSWRQSWGKWFYPRSYIQIFMLQGLLLFLVSIPLTIISTFSTAGIRFSLLVGSVIWLIGFITEFVGDRQLKIFISNPNNKGKIMKVGLWKFSRHPNYFGELTQWWAIGIIALGYSYGWLGLIGPLVISFLIIKISGVPLLEKKYADNKDYKIYKAHTSMLIPFPSKK